MAPPSLSSAPSDGPCPPPPPPPGPPPMFMDDGPKPEDTGAQHSALFAQLNQGEAITKGGQKNTIKLQNTIPASKLTSGDVFCLSGLKHVSDEQKTHKNPNLRSQGGRTHQGSPAKSQNPSCAPAKKHSPVLELEGKKWRVVGVHDA